MLKIKWNGEEQGSPSKTVVQVVTWNEKDRYTLIEQPVH